MKMNDWKVSWRLALGFGALALLLLAVCGMAWQNAQRTRAMIAGDLARADQRLDQAQQMVRLVLEQDLHLRQVGLLTEPPAMEAEANHVKAAAQKLVGMLDALEREGGLSEPEQAALKAVRTLDQQAQPLVTKAINLAMTVMAEDAAKLMTGQIDPLSAQRREHLSAFAASQDTRSRQAAQALDDDARRASALVAVAAVLGVVLAAAAGWWTARSVVQPLQAAVQMASRLSDGDLSVQLRSDRRDEFGQLLTALGGTAEVLRGVIGSIRQSSESVLSASTEIAAGNQNLSERTEQQASHLQETVSTVEQMSGSVRRNAEAAQQATRLAAEASSVASQGGERVGQVVATMDDISSSSKRIADIVGVIDGIAFQTNILALNAAVEAARAGEQGRGFAVVASEVRSLAQRSANAAREIKTLISANVDKVESGTRLVADAGSTMADIVMSAERVAAIISEISHATQEQASGLELVNQSVMRIDEATQQNAALVEESAAAADSLRAQTQSLNDAVGVFRTTA